MIRLDGFDKSDLQKIASTLAKTGNEEIIGNTKEIKNHFSQKNTPKNKKEVKNLCTIPLNTTFFKNTYEKTIKNNDDLLTPCQKSAQKSSNSFVAKIIIEDKPELLKMRINIFGDSFLHYMYRVNGQVEIPVLKQMISNSDLNMRNYLGKLPEQVRLLEDTRISETLMIEQVRSLRKRLGNLFLQM